MMEKVVVISGADRGLGLSLCLGLLKADWRVIAGRYMPEWPEIDLLHKIYPGQLHIVPMDVSSQDDVQNAAAIAREWVKHIDMLINNAGVISPTMHATIREKQDYEEMHRLYDVNALGSLRTVKAFLPLLDKGVMKRLCFVSSEAGSIGRASRESWFGYTMSKAALNMAVKTLYNHLRPDGYTFRLYHPGWMRTYMGGTKNDRADLEPDIAAKYALSYFLGDLDPLRTESDIDPEDRLVMRDWIGRDWPW
jgi:NAD(P)-dependent dehydrogenase (short-subunit alcohol dehydrogenase family)